MTSKTDAISAERWAQIQRIFDAAMDLEAVERTAYVSEKCGADETLLSQIEALMLAADSEEDLVSDLVRSATTSLIDEEQRLNQPIGQFKLVKVIGEGGMGIVYLAIQSVLDRKVALKVTLPSLAEMDESFTKRFVREAKATAALNHPNIITIFDAGVYEKSSYMAMEYIPTGTLADLEDSSLSHEKICELFIGICRGLSAAHNAGFVHRDIKPDNILIDANGHPQVTDFGIVKSLGTIEYSKNRWTAALGQ